MKKQLEQAQQLVQLFTTIKEKFAAKDAELEKLLNETTIPELSLELPKETIQTISKIESHNGEEWEVIEQDANNKENQSTNIKNEKSDSKDWDEWE